MNSSTTANNSAASSPLSFDMPIASTFSELLISLPADEHDYQNDALLDVKPVLRPAPYPSTKPKQPSQQPRRRRKREAIDIPEELISQYDANEVKKIKNRIAAARLRERSQQKIRDLETEIQALRERNAFLESRTASCNHCNGSIATMVDASTTTASPPQSPKSAPASPTPSVHSPSSISEVMTEFESDLLHQLLWQSEEMAAMQMQL